MPRGPAAALPSWSSRLRGPPRSRCKPTIAGTRASTSSMASTASWSRMRPWLRRPAPGCTCHGRLRTRGGARRERVCRIEHGCRPGANRMSEPCRARRHGTGSGLSDHRPAHRQSGARPGHSRGLPTLPIPRAGTASPLLRSTPGGDSATALHQCRSDPGEVRGPADDCTPSRGCVGVSAARTVAIMREGVPAGLSRRGA